MTRSFKKNGKLWIAEPSKTARNDKRTVLIWVDVAVVKIVLEKSDN